MKVESSYLSFTLVFAKVAIFDKYRGTWLNQDKIVKLAITKIKERYILLTNLSLFNTSGYTVYGEAAMNGPKKRPQTNRPFSYSQRYLNLSIFLYILKNFRMFTTLQNRASHLKA